MQTSTSSVALTVPNSYIVNQHLIVCHISPNSNHFLVLKVNKSETSLNIFGDI